MDIDAQRQRAVGWSEWLNGLPVSAERVALGKGALRRNGRRHQCFLEPFSALPTFSILWTIGLPK